MTYESLLAKAAARCVFLITSEYPPALHPAGPTSSLCPTLISPPPCHSRPTMHTQSARSPYRHPLASRHWLCAHARASGNLLFFSAAHITFRCVRTGARATAPS